MPPSVIPTSVITSRRSTGSARQRENRPHNQQGSVSVRRRKSRSPDGRGGDDVAVPTDNHARRKKRPATQGTSGSTPSASNATSRMAIWEDAPQPQADRGRTKSKPKTRPAAIRLDDDDNGDDGGAHFVTNILPMSELGGRAANAVQSGRSKRKERSRSRDAHRLSRKSTPLEPMVDDEEPAYTGPLALGEYARMKQEVETLRKVRLVGLTTRV